MSARPNTAAEMAAAFRSVAEKLDALVDAPLPGVYVSIGIQPKGVEDVQVAAIDTLGEALYGKPGETEQMSSGTYHHSAKGYIAGVSVDAYTSVGSPVERELRAELAALRAQAEPVATEDRHCRSCGATSGLRLLTSSPLELGEWEWECTDSFACGAR